MIIFRFFRKVQWCFMLSKSRSQVTKLYYINRIRVELWNCSQHTGPYGRENCKIFALSLEFPASRKNVNLAIVNLITHVTTSQAFKLHDSLQPVNDRRSYYWLRDSTQSISFRKSYWYKYYREKRHCSWRKQSTEKRGRLRVKMRFRSQRLDWVFRGKPNITCNFFDHPLV